MPTSSSDDFDFAAILTRLSASGVASRVLGFTGDAGATPGDTPIDPLARDGVGRIFGVTAEGGRQQIGVLYRIDASGTYTLLHEFTVGDAPADVGTRPSTSLTLSPDGTTIYGGTYFFAFGENSTALDQQSLPVAFGGFTSSQDFDFSLTPLYKDKSGSLAGQFQLDDNGNIDPTPGNSTVWKKTPQPRDTRFAAGFNTSMTAFGGKYTVPPRGQPPITVPAGDRLRATFNRGGLFGTLSTDFVFTGLNPKADPITDSAQATLKLSARTGIASGKFIPAKKGVKFRGLILQRDQTITGFFLGASDAGRVQMVVVD